MSRYLVTGATGFLGGHLCATLRAHGHDVVALVRAESDALAAIGVEQRRGDVLDEASVFAVADRCEGLFHCAGRVSLDPADAEELHRLHVVGTRTVLDGAQRAGVRRVVIASTSGTVAVSTAIDKVSRETDEAPLALLARWPYYRTKLFAEQEALARNALGFEIVSVNPSLLLGPGDLRGSSTEDVRLFLERRVPATPSGGLSFVDVRDAAEAMLLAMERGVGGERYLVTAANLTVSAFFSRLERISGVKAPWLPMPHAPSLTKAGLDFFERVLRRGGLSLPVDPIRVELGSHTWYADSTKAETVLGWRARDPGETLADTVRDLRERGVVWPEMNDGPPL
ncbi:MAG: NAD-dependent epimerase/dehydratase family protein [Polyangiales bacterium]